MSKCYTYGEAKSVISELFGEDWLNVNIKTHPLQILWNRNDDVAIIELHSFGWALKRLLENGTQRNTLKKLVNRIKKSDLNDQRGIFNEIIGASFISNSNNEPAILCPNGTEIFDCTLSVSETKKMHFSMKSLVINEHRLAFYDSAERIANNLPGLLRTSGMNGQAFSIKCDSYPPNDDFSFINDLIINSLETRKDGESLVIQTEGARIHTEPLDKTPLVSEFDYSSIDSNFSSFIFQMFCPYFDYEVQNFTRNMDKASMDFTKIKKRENNDVYGLFIKVNPYTKISEIIKHFTDWEADGENSVDFIVIICSFLDWNHEEKNRQLTYSVQMFGNKKFQEWKKDLPSNYFSLFVPLGKLVCNFPAMYGISSADPQMKPMENIYAYSKGRIFLRTDSDTAKVSLVAPNVLLLPTKYYDTQGCHPDANYYISSTDTLLIV